MKVEVKCILCGSRRQIGAGEVKSGDQPMCEKCLGPMVPVKARAGR